MIINVEMSIRLQINDIEQKYGQKITEDDVLDFIRFKLGDMSYLDRSNPIPANETYDVTNMDINIFE